MKKVLLAPLILVLTIAPLLLGTSPACAGQLAAPSEAEQMASIRQLNGTFLEVMGNYTDIRQTYLAEQSQGEDQKWLPQVEALYKKISSCRMKLFLMSVSPEHQQALCEAQQNSLYLASSIFEFYDALLTDGDDRRQQLANSAQDYEKALPYFTILSAASH